jgi:hypothetical protein
MPKTVIFPLRVYEDLEKVSEELSLMAKKTGLCGDDGGFAYGDLSGSPKQPLRAGRV